MNMNGQWIGTYTGSTVGTIIVNIDERELNYQGVASLIPNDTNTHPGIVASFRTPGKPVAQAQFQFRTDLLASFDPKSGMIGLWENVKQHYPPMEFPKYADVTGTWDEHSLNLNWLSNLGDQGTCVLPRSQAVTPSKLNPLEMDWTAYKEYVAGLKATRHLFRGQNGPRRLRTSFHRTGRADLSRFTTEDIPTLYRHLSARTKHIFDLRIPDQNGAFYNLVQHHGYPTPLLDWTFSPYVAAFFAYRGISKEAATGPNTKVRIHVFDQAKWKTDWIQSPLLVMPGLHLSIMEFTTMENERMIPQQAASIVTNIDDIESYIASKDSEAKMYLRAIDLPKSDRHQVVR